MERGELYIKGATCLDGIRSRKLVRERRYGEQANVLIGSRRKNTRGCAKWCLRAISASRGSCTIDKVGRLAVGHRERASKAVSKYAP